MIKYIVTRNNIKTQARDLSIFYLRPVHVIGAISLPLSIYLLIVGYTASEPEALKMGYPALALSALSLLFFVIGYFTFRKALLASFEKNAENGKLEYEINKNDGNVERTCASNDIFSFSIENIEKVSHTKDNIIVRLKSKELLVFPMQEDILKLLR